MVENPVSGSQHFFQGAFSWLTFLIQNFFYDIYSKIS